MRAPLSFLIALPLATAQAQAPRTTPPRPDCKPTAGLVDHRPGGPARIRPLQEMPAAARVLAVYREVDGCPTPIVLETGVDARR